MFASKKERTPNMYPFKPTPNTKHSILTLLFLGVSVLKLAESIVIGYNSETTNHGAISLAIEQAQRDGLLATQNIRFVSLVFHVALSLYFCASDF